jgi:hypothetical protein
MSVYCLSSDLAPAGRLRPLCAITDMVYRRYNSKALAQKEARLVVRASPLRVGYRYSNLLGSVTSFDDLPSRVVWDVHRGIAAGAR